MIINPAGIQIIQEFEGCALKAYRDLRGIWTIGYGSTTGVTPEMTITQESALKRLMDDLDIAENVVSKQITVPLNNNQFSALVSFTFNEGAGHLAESTLKAKLNQGDYIAAANALMLWDKVRGFHVLGLARRRAAERELFLTPCSA